MKLTKAEIHAMENLSALAKNAMRSKTILKTLSGLLDRGLIDFDPMEATASITPKGATALAGAKS